MQFGTDPFVFLYKKTFLVQGKTFCEVVDNNKHPMNAAVYDKREGKYYVGYRNPSGITTVYEKDGILNLGGEWDWENGTELYRVDLYEDVGGKYFPKLTDVRFCYKERPDGRVELVTSNEDGSRGIVVENLRGLLANG
jgi:hypothetical protein